MRAIAGSRQLRPSLTPASGKRCSIHEPRQANGPDRCVETALTLPLDRTARLEHEHIAPAACVWWLTWMRPGTPGAFRRLALLPCQPRPGRGRTPSKGSTRPHIAVPNAATPNRASLHGSRLSKGDTNHKSALASPRYFTTTSPGFVTEHIRAFATESYSAPSRTSASGVNG